MSRCTRADDLQPARGAQIFSTDRSAAIADRFIHDVPTRFDQFQLCRGEFVRCAEIQRRADEENVLERILE